MNDGEIVEIHGLVEGLVQGVSFRASVRYHANRLGVTGTVRNLSDGRVEFYAQGTRPQLHKLFDAMRHDSSPARVDAIRSKEKFPLGQYDGFRVI